MRARVRAPQPVISRQVAYQQRHQTSGLCQRCAQPLAPGSKISCLPHLLQDRERKRKKLDLQPWQEGRRGRKPLTETTKDEWGETG